jgi:putative phosphoesterase
MKIGVLSDTHLSNISGVLSSIKHVLRNKRTLADLRDLISHHFREVDLIIHAGDFVELAVLEMLQEFAPVEAVQGNMDPAVIRATLPEQKILEFEGLTIGITHGNGGPQGILERVKSIFRDKQVDAIVFGHTHHPINEKQEGILFFNPGSPTDRIFAPYNSLGILDVSERIEGKIIRLDE